MTIPFVHLHTHSHYSLLNGTTSPKLLVDCARRFKMPAIALTDEGNLFGVMEFYRHATNSCSQQVRPIIGYEAGVAVENRFGKNEITDHLTLLVMNQKGWRNLVRLSSLAFIEGSTDCPMINKELLRKYNDGLICLSGFASGELGRLLAEKKQNGFTQSRKTAEWFCDVFGDRYYLELQNHGLNNQRQLIMDFIELGRQLDIPTVATNNVHYIDQTDRETYDMLLRMKLAKYPSNQRCPKIDSRKLHFCSGDEMLAAMPDHIDAIRRTVEIAHRIEDDIFSDIGKYTHFPFIPLMEGVSAKEQLRQCCQKGFVERYANSPLQEKAAVRLETELAVIEENAYENYLLIIADIIRFADEHGIFCTVRGAAAGSLVCHVLNMSHLCPLTFGLLFERLIDEKRDVMLDIDIDVDAGRRGEIIDYIETKFGKDHVAQEILFEKISSQGAIRHSGRLLGLASQFVETIACEFPDSQCQMPFQKIHDHIHKNQPLLQRYHNERDVKKLIDHAIKTEGIPIAVRAKNTENMEDVTFLNTPSLIVSANPLIESVPLMRIADDPRLKLQWGVDYVHLDRVDPFLRLDILPAKELKKIADIVRLVCEKTGKDVDPYSFPLDDKATFELLQCGKTDGIFGLNGENICEHLRRLQPNCFQDIMAILSLDHPLPLEYGLLEQYINHKHGKHKPSYIDPVLDGFFAETHGVPIYHEQIMMALHQIGNIPLNQTYRLVKSMCKLKTSYIEQRRRDFLDGARENDHNEETGAAIYDWICRHARFGLCKSHAMVYGQIAFIQAYLKTHCPNEFDMIQDMDDCL